MKVVFNNKGSILLQILLVFMLLSMLCLALISIIYMDFLIFNNTKDSTTAFYVSESGMELALQKETASPAIVYPYTIEIKESESTDTLGTCVISKSGDTLVSRGTVGRVSRTVTASFSKTVNMGENNLQQFWSNPYKYQTSTNQILNPKDDRSVNNLIDKNNFIYIYPEDEDFSPGSLVIENKNGARGLIVKGNFTPTNKIEFYGILYVTGKIILQPGSVLHGFVYSESTEPNSIDVADKNYIENSSHGEDYSQTVIINGVIASSNYNQDKIVGDIFLEDGPDSNNLRKYEEDIEYANWVISNLLEGETGAVNISVKTWRETR